MKMKLNILMASGAMIALSACGGASLGSSTLLDGGRFAESAPPPIATPADENFGRILNSYRNSVNAGPVAHDDRLDAAAQAYADDLATHNRFSHTGRDGSTALDRIQAAGYVPRAYAENLAGRQQADQEALSAWINSAEHDRALRHDGFQDFALGVAGRGAGTRWVLLLGSE